MNQVEKYSGRSSKEETMYIGRNEAEQVDLGSRGYHGLATEPRFSAFVIK